MGNDRLGCRDGRADGGVVDRCRQQWLYIRLGLDCAWRAQLSYPAQFGRAFFFQVAFAALTFFSGCRRMAGFRHTVPGQLDTALAEPSQQRQQQQQAQDQRAQADDAGNGVARCVLALWLVHAYPRMADAATGADVRGAAL